VPIPFAFPWLNAFKAAITHSHSLSDPSLCLVTKANRTLTAFRKIVEALKKKNQTAMMALSKFLVLLSLFLSAMHTNAFTCLSPIARNQVRGNHLI
jgi:hypothetical protein